MLITIEGIDGSGKSTLHESLGKALADLDPVMTREPGSTWIGEAVRRAIREQADPVAEALLFIADHAAHISEVIRPALSRGRIVISDRYIDSRYAYQQVTLAGILPDPLSWLQAVHTGWTVKPDITFLLVVPIPVALKRTGERKTGEHFEQETILTAVQKNYLGLAEQDPPRFIILDGTLPAEHLIRVAAETIRYKREDPRRR
ncbi:MAG: dTMP kinase [Methanospirillum sp.]|nr:dTMP kinase [Methanospirillum sp.]